MPGEPPLIVSDDDSGILETMSGIFKITWLLIAHPIEWNGEFGLDFYFTEQTLQVMNS